MNINLIKISILGEICKILIKYSRYLSTQPNAGLYEFIYDAVTNNDAQVGA